MTAREFISKLLNSGADLDKPIYVQQNYNDGAYIVYEIKNFQAEGHAGADGSIVHVTPRLDVSVASDRQE